MSLLLLVMWVASCGTVPRPAELAAPGSDTRQPLDGFCPQVVQGLIDWGSPKPGSFASVRHIYKEGWNEFDGTHKWSYYATEDGLILCPKGADIDAFAPIGVLAGAVLTQGSPGHAKPHIDRYELWLWEDVNYNRQADPDDRVEGELQEWRRVASDEPWQLNRIINVVPEDSAFAKAREGLYAGKAYLLLIRVWAGELDSFQFTGPVSVDLDSGEAKAEWGRRVENNWTPTGPGAYGAADGSGWHGIDDYEVLSFRVNNPPAKPIVP